MNTRTPTSDVLASLFAFGLMLASCSPALAQSQGAVEGRVFNAATGAAVANARVSVEDTQTSVLTDANGDYRLAGLPLGAVRLRVFYLGFGTQEASVQISADRVAQRNFELGATDARPDGQPIVMDKVSVVAERAASAQALAVNERRNAANIKHVVAFDEYGNVGEEGVGEFLRFLPGVAVNNGGSVATFLTLRGMPSANSPIQLEGFDVAGARNDTRAQHLFDIPMSNISRVEVTKVPTPDMPASGIGGSVNLITKSGFESKKPTFAYKVYSIYNKKVTLDGGPPGPIPELSPKYQQPSFSFSYLHPVNDRLAFSLSGTRTWRLKPMERNEYSDTQAVWNFVDLTQRQSTYFSLADILQSWAGQIGADFKISSKDILNLSFQRRRSYRIIFQDSLTATYGAGSIGDRTFSQSSTANGQIQHGTGSHEGTRGDTSHLTAKFEHREDTWRLNASFARSTSTFDNIDLGLGSFNTINATVRNAIIRGEGIGETDALIPTRFRATVGGVAVNPYDGANYSILSATSEARTSEKENLSGRLDFTWKPKGKIAVTFKAGGFVNREDRNYPFGGVQTWNFNPNGLTTDAARRAGQFDVFDDAFNASAPTVLGTPMRRISKPKVYNLYLQRPEWFVPAVVPNFINAATYDRQLIETISGGYLRGDVSLMQNRLSLVGGARWEKTKVDGLGLLDDPSLQFQRDANGNLIRGGNGQPVLITTDAVARANLRYVPRGTHVVRTYDGIYPSLNATYLLSEKVLLRGGYARTTGRPNVNFILPGATLSEPTETSPFITVNNPGLKPWTANGYDLSLESYFFKGGSGSIGVFRRDIKDFFGSVSMMATPELLATLGLPTDERYLNYEIRTQSNVGDAQVDGIEFTYRQALPFLKGLSVFANVTKLKLKGNQEANFAGFAPANYAGGISLVRDRFSIKINGTHQAEARGNLIAVNLAVGNPPGTYAYTGESTRFNLEAEYALSKKFALFFTINDLRKGGLVSVTRRYPDGVPDYVKDIRRQELGATMMLGVSGKF